MLPDYVLIGGPRRFKDGRGNQAASYLKTTDLVTSRRRAVKYVEARIREDQLARDPQARTMAKGINAARREYLSDLTAVGNSSKQVSLVETRICRVIKQAKLKDYSHVDAVTITQAISKLMAKYKFGIVTANKYVEAMKAWAAWMSKNNRWGTNPLRNMAKLKGDTTPRKRRAILTVDEFAKLLRGTMEGSSQRCLSGEQRHYLYLVAGMTGLRAQELNSLRPSSFDFVNQPATVTIHCTISKRRRTDILILHPNLVAMLKPWVAKQDLDRRLWGNSGSWYYKAGSILRSDLAAAGIESERDGCQIDFHSFRAFAITRAVLSGRPTRTVLQAVRLSSESLLSRYTKIAKSDVEELVEAVPPPRLALRVVG